MSHNNNNNHHQSRRNVTTNFQSDSNSNAASSRRQHLMDFTPTSVIGSAPPTDRPVTRSVTKRNLQHQNDPSVTMRDNIPQASTNATGGILHLNSNSHDINNNSNEKILKLIETRQQQSQLKSQQQPMPPQKTYQKIIVNERPCNLINILERTRMGGTPIRNTSNVIGFYYLKKIGLSEN